MRLLLLVLLVLPFAARAQDRAALVADRLFVRGETLLIAEGNVEAFFEGTTLSARRVTYDRAADRLLVEGPILIRDPSGAILTAARADIDPRLEQGLLEGARLVLDRQVQIAAARVDRVDGLTALTGASVTSCQVCPGRRPLWQIDAARVVRDEAAEQVYFENATFRIRGVPVIWLPRLRLPEPGNERATGFLAPRIRTTDQLGVGLRLPFFLELGATRDLTLTPYLSGGTRTLELRYRQAFLAGDVALTGAVTRDDIRPLDTRGFVRATGAFEWGPLDLAFDATAVSDDAYLLDYGWSDDDRIESAFALSAVEGDTLLLGEVVAVRSLRTDEVGGSLPPLLGSLSVERRRPAAGGILSFGASLDGFLRTTDAAGEAGRDVARAGAFAGWQRGVVGPRGLLFETEGRLALDAFRVTDDPAFHTAIPRAAPAATATLRWPLVRAGAGVRDLVEPVAQVGWARGFGGEPPGEDALLPELDEANIFALTRLPGEDAVEDGARLALGASWTRAGPGWTSSLFLGRILRPDDDMAASAASGLDGVTSATLLAAGLDLGAGFVLDARTLVAGEGFGKSEARLDWDGRRLSVEAAYVYVPSDLAESREEEAAEWSAAAEFRPSAAWEVSLGGRYDLAADRPARAEAGVTWRNECVEVDASLSRRYTEAGGAEPSTDFGLSINLLGFAADGVAPGACRD